MTTVHTTSTLEFGRFVVTARNNHLVVDSSPGRGGTGEAIQPVETFLAGLASCTASSFQYWAREKGVPVREVRVTVSAETNATGPAGFARIQVDVEAHGTTRTRLAAVEEAYRQTCPVYSTISATIPIELNIRGRR